MNIFQKFGILLLRIWDLIPIYQCSICLLWFNKNDIEFHQTTIGFFDPVCEKCWNEINKAVKNG